MKPNRNKIGEYGAIGLAALVVAVVVFLPDDEPSPPEPRSKPILVCIDSTKSTDDVRGKYRVDLESLVRRSASHQDHFLAAACGANATGEVDWPVSRWFREGRSEGDFPQQELDRQIEVVINGEDEQEKEGIVDLLERESKESTPIGEMLAVTGRQCAQVGGDCEIYLFTDGEWADGLLRVKTGISEEERERYLDTYDSELEGLSGTTVNFIGVGLKTEMGELRLAEAKSIAEDLVRQAGGTMGNWTARL